jgi:pimeloyl-ACP methyl ester carboxylesterase
MKTDCLIVLIHGTFATNATWPLGGSEFRRRLEEALEARGIGSVEFQAIRWNGGNRDIDRVRASLHLRRRLKYWSDAQPDRPVFLIGHSHGGNIALHAVGHSAELRRMARGVVTLATPFLIFDEQPAIIARIAVSLFDLRFGALRLAGWTLVNMVLFCLFYFVFPWIFDLQIWMLQSGMQLRAWLCRLLVSPGTCDTIYDALAFVLGLVMGLLNVGGFAATSWDSSAQSHKLALAKASASLDRFSYVQPQERLAGVPILVLSSPLDEARQGLNGAWWMHRASLWAARLGLILAIAAGLAVAVWTLTWANIKIEAQIAANASTRSLWLNSLSSYAAMSLFGVAVAVVGSLFRGFVRLPVPGHGGRQTLNNLLFTQRVKRWPFESGQVKKMSYKPSELLKSAPGLLHSSLYQHPRASADIAEWISDNLISLKGQGPCPHHSPAPHPPPGTPHPFSR